VLSYACRHFDGRVGIARRPGGDGDDQKLGAMLLLFDRDDHYDRAILAAFFPAGLGFAVPERGISEDLSRFRNSP